MTSRFVARGRPTSRVGVFFWKYSTTTTKTTTRTGFERVARQFRGGTSTAKDHLLKRGALYARGGCEGCATRSLSSLGRKTSSVGQADISWPTQLASVPTLAASPTETHAPGGTPIPQDLLGYVNKTTTGGASETTNARSSAFCAA